MAKTPLEPVCVNLQNTCKICFDTNISFGKDTGVAFGFTQRMGGVSKPPYSSLNVALHVHDDVHDVKTNRERALHGLSSAYKVLKPSNDMLVNPVQVHETNIIVIDEAISQKEAATFSKTQADAVVCTIPNIPVLLCFADCTPVIAIVKSESKKRAFGIAHAGWRGAYNCISSKMVQTLCDTANVTPEDVHVFLGPHVSGDKYQVSFDLADKFRAKFGQDAAVGERNVSLTGAIMSDLSAHGVLLDHIYGDEAQSCTVTHNDKYFSYRQEGPTCGRHGALAWIAE